MHFWTRAGMPPATRTAREPRAASLHPPSQTLSLIPWLRRLLLAESRKRAERQGLVLTDGDIHRSIAAATAAAAAHSSRIAYATRPLGVRCRPRASTLTQCPKIYYTPADAEYLPTLSKRLALVYCRSIMIVRRVRKHLTGSRAPRRNCSPIGRRAS